MVDRIEQALSAKDPANAGIFQVNARPSSTSSMLCSAELQQALQPLAGKPYVVAHDAFQYLERRYRAQRRRRDLAQP